MSENIFLAWNLRHHNPDLHLQFDKVTGVFLSDPCFLGKDMGAYVYSGK